MQRLIRQCRTSKQKAAHGCAMRVAAPRRCDFGRRGWGVCVQIDHLPVASELNPLAPHAPWGLMPRLTPLHECGGAGVPPHLWTRFAAPTERTRDRDAFSICITFVQPIFTAKQGEQAR